MMRWLPDLVNVFWIHSLLYNCFNFMSLLKLLVAPLVLVITS